ncbi:MAG: hypothetical protein KGZ85_13705 [Ignavibacterium sp.]|nr:hypothetical protein [Ignavibacterium sp.]
MNSLILSMASSLITIIWFKKFNRFSYSFLWMLLVLALTPLVMNIVFSLITEFCSFIDGVLFYITITLPAILVGFSLGIFSVYVAKKFSIILFITFILLIASIPVIEIYFNPQIYFYNPLIGNFPGSIYDEGMVVELKLVLYRLLNSIFFAAIVYMIFKDKKRSHIIRNSSLIILVTAAFFFASPYLGFSTNYSKLSNLLPQKYTTEKFIFHLPSDLSEMESKQILLHSEYYFRWLQNSIKETPSERIEIFLFESNDQKKEYFGSGTADVAKPWLYQVYLSRGSWQSTLKHELGHIFSAEFGSTIFKLSGGLNPFLIEGFATSQDPFRDELHIDYLSSLALFHYKELRINHLLKGFNFFASNSFLTYTYAGSFSKYLINNYSIDNYKKLYSNLDFIKSYGLSSDSLIAEYNFFLESISFEQNEHRFYYYFGRQSITQKTCPRYIGSLLRNGWEQVSKNKPEQAKNYFRSVLNMTPNYSAIVGLSEIFSSQDSVQQSINLISSTVTKFEKTPFYYLLRFRLADLYARHSNSDSASILYEQIKFEKPTIGLDIIALVRLKLLEKDLLRNYLNSNDSAKYAILSDLNRIDYFYPSIPAMITLSNSSGQDYSDFIKQFNKTIFITDFYSAYAVYNLSRYMLLKFDYRNSRKMAALAKRYNEDEHFNLLWQDNFEKADWFYYNADEFLQHFSSKLIE